MARNGEHQLIIDWQLAKGATFRVSDVARIASCTNTTITRTRRNLLMMPPENTPRRMRSLTLGQACIIVACITTHAHTHSLGADELREIHQRVARIDHPAAPLPTHVRFTIEGNPVRVECERLVLALCNADTKAYRHLHAAQ